VWLWSLGGAPGMILMGQVPWDAPPREKELLDSCPPYALPGRIAAAGEGEHDWP